MNIRELIQEQFDKAIEEDFGKAEKPHDKWRNIYRAKQNIKVNGMYIKRGEEYPGYGVWPSKDIAYTKAMDSLAEGDLHLRDYVRTEKV